MRKLPDNVLRIIEANKERILSSCDKCGGTDRFCGCHLLVEGIVLLAFGGVPEEYWWYKLNEFPGDQAAQKQTQSYIDHIAEMRDEGLGLLFVGLHGIGKTSLCCSVLKGAVAHRLLHQDEETGWTVQYKTLSQIITELVMLEKGRGRDTTKFDLVLWHEEMMVDFLVIDDIGKEYSSKNQGWKMPIFDNILRRRKANKLPTIISTNIPIERKQPGALTLDEFYGDSIASILHSMLVPVKVGGDDMRRDSAVSKYLKIIKDD